MSQRVTRRFDATAELAPAARDGNGFLRVEGRISRVGIQEYEAADGKVIRELRLPEDVFDAESIASFAHVPVTNTHPPALLDPSSAKAFAVGSLGEPRKDGDYLVASILLFDGSAIAAAERGRVQLSCGYGCEIDWTPGTWQGQAYDAVQRKIRGNHVALVDVGRAGPEARIRLDAAGNVQLLGSNPRTPSDPEKKPMPQAIKIDGLSLELSDANAPAIQQALERAIGTEKARADGVAKERDQLAAKRARIVVNLDARRARIDAAKARMVPCDECAGTGKVEADGAEAKCDYCDGAGSFRMHDVLKGAVGGPTGEAKGDDPDDDDEDMDADELETEQATETESAKTHKDAAREARAKKILEKRRAKLDAIVARKVRARVALEVEARRHLGDSAKLDGKADDEVRRLVVAKLAPTAKLDGKGTAAIRARYDAEIERAVAGEVSPIDQARGSAAAPSLPAAAGSPTARRDEARKKMMDANASAWKRPATVPAPATK